MEVSTQATDYNPALHVLGIPELTKLICRLVSRRDNASLSCVCHQLFRELRPILWERVDCVEVLVQTIPETRLEVYRDDPLPPYSVMYLPKSLDLSRLSIYSPYIKCLDIPWTTMVDSYEDWAGFIALARSNTLLPNLKHLKLAIPQRTHGETLTAASLNWMLAFISPSLLSFQIYPDLTWDSELEKYAHAWINLICTTGVLRAVAGTCPRLSSLMILTADIRTEVGFIDDHPVLGPIRGAFLTNIMFQWPPSAPDLGLDLIFSQFNYLRQLSSTPYILEPAAFRALSKLPHLEFLSIRDLHIPGNHFQSYCFALDSHLDPDAFPALRHLELIDLTYDTIINICKRKPLAKALHTLKPTITGWPDVRPNKLAQLLRILAEYDSTVTRLCIPFALPGWGLFPQSAGHLSCLKLTHLSLPHPAPEGSDYEINQLLHSVPSLKSLEFSSWRCDNYLPLRMLRSFAELLPNLNRLSIPLEFYSTEKLGEEDFVPHSSQSFERFCLESTFRNEVDNTQGSFQIKDPIALAKYTNKIASYLHALWPNIECKSKESSYEFDLQDPPHLIQLHNLIRQLRGESNER